MAVALESVGSGRFLIPQNLRKRAIALTAHNRPGSVPLPGYIGLPGMAVISDSHGAVETYLRLHEALPSSVKFRVDLGDKVDRGPEPLETNYLLQTLGVMRTLGNHDAMWVAAGLGVKAQAIELVRWLMRYNEVDFLTGQLGVDLTPLREYADRNFGEGSHRLDVKSKEMGHLEAAATYLKIIAEASIRFPEHADTVLSESDIRIRQALFFTEAIVNLTPTERELFDRLTADEKLSAEDSDYFYRLVGGLKTLTEEEQNVVDHFAKEFLGNYRFYQFVKWMAGEGDLYFGFRTRQGYPCDLLATHATVPIDKNGNLATFVNGKTGRDMLIDLKMRIQLGLEGWRQLVEHDDPSLLQMHRDDIDVLGLLPWDVKSPLYARQMQTAARAVLREKTGTWVEAKEPFFTHFEQASDPEFVKIVMQNIAVSFGFGDSSKVVIVRGHEPSKSFNADVLAHGHVINIDAGMAPKYGGRGGALVVGSTGAAWLSYPGLQYSRVPLPGAISL